MYAKKRYGVWKKVAAVLLIVSIAFWGYVEIVNRNSKHMTGKQKLLKAFYPLWVGFSKLTGKRSNIIQNNKQVQPVQPVYELPIVLNNNDTITLKGYKGKKILLVNTASNCGYTRQYEALENLYRKFNDKLVIIGFPANDFGEQEKGSNEQIAQFCKANFGVTFPLAKKSVVINSAGQNPIFNWLTDKNKNGWNEKQPSWNFSKYLINEQGILTHYFDPAVSPTSNEVIGAIGNGG